MNQTLIKVYDTEFLLSDAHEKITQLTRDDFKPYILRYEQHKLCVLENENLILFSLLFDRCQTIINEESLTITFSTMKDTKIITIKFPDKKAMSYIQHQINARKAITQYMGPLAYQPVRKERTSLLSTESPEQNYRGILNLALLILIANHIRLIFENFQKYGWMITHKFLQFDTVNINGNPIMQGFIVLGLNVFLGYIIQIGQFQYKMNPEHIRVLNIFNISMTIIAPCYLIQGSHPSLNLIFLGVQFIIFMKLISYAHFLRNTYFYIKRIQSVNSKSKVKLSDFFSDFEINQENLLLLEKHFKNPQNLINLNHFLYFLAAPTLCFQLSYIRNQHIRKIWLVKRIVEYIVVLIFLVIIWFQYTEPLVENTYKIYKKDPGIMILLDRLLKLAIPNTYMWIALFFGQFQCFLNITAELLRFADREFYKDWWNCKNLEGYWRLWNLPVHHWMVRHIYFPCIKTGISKTTANFIVFFVSAIGHEYIVSASIGIVELWAFVGMLAQAPAMYLQRKIEKILNLQDSQLGNLMFWLTFCFIGQPFMIFVYYFRYLEKVGHPI